METLAEQLFTFDEDGNTAAGDKIVAEIEEILRSVDVPFEKTGFDWYDNSIELYGVDNDYRLSDTAHKAVFDMGFAKVYVNHKDYWETHYYASSKEGWRVSYPHKRPENKGPILVEKHIESWGDWFKTGYARIVGKN